MAQIDAYSGLPEPSRRVPAFHGRRHHLDARLPELRLASDGERYRAYVAHGKEVLKFEEFPDPAEALATGWLWRDPK